MKWVDKIKSMEPTDLIGALLLVDFFLLTKIALIGFAYSLFKEMSQ